jgi:hypothetical protein
MLRGHQHTGYVSLFSRFGKVNMHLIRTQFTIVSFPFNIDRFEKSIVETTRLASLNRVIKTTVSNRSVPRVVVSL